MHYQKFIFPFSIYQEENKILDKMHRQKVAEVEKLSQTVRELEEAVLAGGAAANAVRDYQRKVQEINVMIPHINAHRHSHNQSQVVWTTLQFLFLTYNIHCKGGEENP